MKILVADDDPVLRRLLQSFLTESGHGVIEAKDGTEAWQILQAQGAPRLAVLDWMMPGMDGVEVCREVRKRVAQPYAYIILLTAKDDKLDVIDGLEAGADDYLTKPFNPQELEARLRVGKRVLDLEDNLVAARELMHYKATHDGLTGLWNRAAILEFLSRELQRAGREGGSLGILIADLDHFKSINDTWGHLVGDAVLRGTARRLKAAVRAYDQVGRYGGEEFLIVLMGCDRSTTLDRAEHFRALIGGHPVESAEGSITVTLSMGGVASGD